MNKKDPAEIPSMALIYDADRGDDVLPCPLFGFLIEE